MARVLIVCVAGVSGTFLARRMRALDDGLEPVVTPLESLGSDGFDAVLLAPQLASRAAEVSERVRPVPVGVLASTAFRVDGAEEAVMQARDLLEAPAYRGIPTTETKE